MATELLLAVIAFVLVVISYQLFKSNRLLEMELALEDAPEGGESKKRKLFRDKFPHIYSREREQLKEYEANLRRKQEYFRNYNRYSAFDPDDFGELVTWIDVSAHLNHATRHDEEKNRIVKRLYELSNKFYKRVFKDYEITEAEAQYILYLFWKRIQVDIWLGKSDMDIYNMWLEEYLDWFPKKSSRETTRAKSPR